MQGSAPTQGRAPNRHSPPRLPWLSPCQFSLQDMLDMPPRMSYPILHRAGLPQIHPYPRSLLWGHPKLGGSCAARGSLSIPLLEGTHEGLPAWMDSCPDGQPRGWRWRALSSSSGVPPLPSLPISPSATSPSPISPATAPFTVPDKMRTRCQGRTKATGCDTSLHPQVLPVGNPSPQGDIHGAGDTPSLFSGLLSTSPAPPVPQSSAPARTEAFYLWCLCLALCPRPPLGRSGGVRELVLNIHQHPQCSEGNPLVTGTLGTPWPQPP